MLMVQVEEAFDVVSPIFINIAKELSIYSKEPYLVTDLIGFDEYDGSITVRISNDGYDHSP